MTKALAALLALTAGLQAQQFVKVSAKTVALVHVKVIDGAGAARFLVFVASLLRDFRRVLL